MTASENPQRLMLVDAASLYFRAFYGVPEQGGAPSKLPTNAVRGFLDMLGTLVNRWRPTDLVACWDNDWRPAFRVEAVPTYKTHRVAVNGETGAIEEDSPDELTPQVPIIVEALAALGIARVGVDGYEADDVIGSYVAQRKGQLPIDVVTGDRDLFQLVDDTSRVRVLYTARGGVRDADLVTEDFLQTKYGVPTGAAYADLATLRGDTSDGLPGVAGVGEKTAAKLLDTFGSLAAIREAITSGDPRIKGAQRTRLEAASDYLDVAPAVVRVVPDIVLPDTPTALPTHVADPALMSRLAVDHGLTSTFDRIISALGLA